MTIKFQNAFSSSKGNNTEIKMKLKVVNHVRREKGGGEGGGRTE